LGEGEVGNLEKARDAFRTISEVADDLDLPQHVLRFWESRFAQLKPMKRGGGRRYYRPEDVDLLRGIRFLLYGEGYTIRGVQRILREQGIRFVQSVWQEGAAKVLLSPPSDDADDDEEENSAPQLLGALIRTVPRDEIEPAEDEGEVSTLSRIEPSLRPTPLRQASDPVSKSPDRLTDRRDGASAGLTREQVERLQATLEELDECRRLLDHAHDDDEES
jgi:DNA-binding transcriptional MerR regulator